MSSPERSPCWATNTAFTAVKLRSGVGRRVLLAGYVLLKPALSDLPAEVGSVVCRRRTNLDDLDVTPTENTKSRSEGAVRIGELVNCCNKHVYSVAASAASCQTPYLAQKFWPWRCQLPPSALRNGDPGFTTWLNSKSRTKNRLWTYQSAQWLRPVSPSTCATSKSQFHFV